MSFKQLLDLKVRFQWPSFTTAIILVCHEGGAFSTKRRNARVINHDERDKIVLIKLVQGCDNFG